jgi:hypothetical protein
MYSMLSGLAHHAYVSAGFINAQFSSTLQLCRFERWNFNDEVTNEAKTDYIAGSGPDAAGEREPLKELGCQTQSPHSSTHMLLDCRCRQL